MNTSTDTMQIFDTKHVEALEAVLARAEARLVELTECLQKEREYVTVFDVGSLLSTLDRKRGLLEGFERDGAERRTALSRLWNDAGRDQASLPESMPDALRGLAAQADPELSSKLGDRADRFEALVDVVTELNSVNQSLVSRSLSWIEAYIGEISGAAASTTYNANGRMKRRSLSAIRSKI
jgi:flagellar biosynthesis/type III secretory pathway chaperone